MIGQTISHYKILEKLGEGGMGVVYKAQDTRLDRLVALKFLPDHVAVGSAELERFVQEAKAAAGLSHPNICTIYGIEEAEKKHFIVMEFVDGQMLQEKKAALSMKQALDIGIQIADGLAAAHEKGIVHRDIKPENIMIRKDGRVQIMDFGLAKLRGASRLTKEGSTVGTAGYMSPEQVQGLETDHRSDIFSLGVLLYEMLTGQPPFKGMHETAIAYEIINVESPPPSSIKPEIPPDLDVIVLECLEKDGKERTQSAGQVALDLKRFRRASSRQRMSHVTTARPALTGGNAGYTKETPPVWLSIPWIISAVSLLIALALGVQLVFFSSQATPLVTAMIASPTGTNFFLYGNQGGPATISPDGKFLAFVASDSIGKRYLYVHAFDGSGAKRLDDAADAISPFWSPDGRFLGFGAEGKLKWIDATGGSAVTIAQAPFLRGGTWTEDGIIIYAPGVGSPIRSVTASGGDSHAITSLDSTRAEDSHRWPSILPDGKHIIYFARTRSSGNRVGGGAVMVSELDGSSNKLIVETPSNAVYASGYLLFSRGTSLIAQKFDLSDLELVGDPTTIAEGVTYDPSTSRSLFTASSNGMLVYQTGVASLGSRLVLRDRTGRPVGRPTDVAEYIYTFLAPDGKRASVYIWDQKALNADIWIVDLINGLRTRFTFNPAVEAWSVWSPDGKQIAFNSDRTGLSNIYVKPTNAIGGEVPLAPSTETGMNPRDWSRDGKYILVEAFSTRRNDNSLWVVPTTGDHTPLPLVSTGFDDHDGRFSPDGRWIAYVSTESGSPEVYIRPFQPLAAAQTQSAAKWQVSDAGGDSPRWRGDGKELFYFGRDNKIMAVDLTFVGGAVNSSRPRTLFEVPSIVQLPISDFDVTRDGQRFLINTPFDVQNATPLTLVVNWEQRLKGK